MRPSIHSPYAREMAVARNLLCAAICLVLLLFLSSEPATAQYGSRYRSGGYGYSNRYGARSYGNDRYGGYGYGRYGGGGYGYGGGGYGYGGSRYGSRYGRGGYGSYGSRGYGYGGRSRSYGRYGSRGYGYGGRGDYYDDRGFRGGGYGNNRTRSGSSASRPSKARRRSSRTRSRPLPILTPEAKARHTQRIRTVAKRFIKSARRKMDLKDSGRAAIDLMCALRMNADKEQTTEARIRLREMEVAAEDNLRGAVELMEKKDYAKGVRALRNVVRRYHGLDAAKRAARELANYERNPEVREAIRKAEELTDEKTDKKEGEKAGK